MPIEYVPLLRPLREVYRLPRDPARFQQYLRTALTADRQDVEFVPLIAANPMAKEQAVAVLDAWLALDADAVAESAAHEAANETGLTHPFRAGLAFLDVNGGWTNRYTAEYGFRMPDPFNKRFWITGALWSGDPPSARLVRETMRAAVFRTAHAVAHGTPRTVGELLRQEGYALAAAGCHGPTLDPDDLEYTREVIAPYLGETDMRTAVQVLFGDAAGATLGFPPLGLSPNAGLAAALHDARGVATRLGPSAGVC